MDVLLLNPRYPQGVNNNPPLGLAYIAAYLEREGIKVGLLDDEIERLDRRELKKRIMQEKPLIVGISATTAAIPESSKVAGLIKEILPETIIVLGGVHCSALPKETLQQFPDFDIVVKGEGEKPFLDLARMLKKNEKNFKEIKGIHYRKGGKIISNMPGELITNLDELPLPARHLMDMEEYISRNSDASERMFIDVISPFHGKRLRVTEIFVGRGCPYNCIYCAGKVALGRIFRIRSVGNIIKELKMLKKTYGINAVFLQDDTPTISKKWLMDFCRALKKEKLGMYWAGNARAENIDEETVREMYDSGCRCLAIGVESYSQKFLDALKRGNRVGDIRRAFILCRKQGIRTFGYFMFNLPGETLKDMQNTLKFVNELKPDVTQFSILTPYPGTEAYERYMNKSNDNWGRYLYMHDVICNLTKNVSDKELLDFFNFAREQNRKQQIKHLNIKFIKLLGYRIRTNPKRFLKTIAFIPKFIYLIFIQQTKKSKYCQK